MRYALVPLVVLLLAGCGGSDSPLFPELKGRWAPEKGMKARAVMMTKNASATAPNLKELCASQYVTFSKYPDGSKFAGAVFLYRDGKRDIVYLVSTAKREGARIILTGQEPNTPLAGPGNSRLELVMRNGEVAFGDIIDQRGRSVRYDRFKADDAISQQRAGLNTIGDIMGSMFDLKPCTT